jgi:glutathione synthase/RimK-type ligase-like ATP-grasp enzyme
MILVLSAPDDIHADAVEDLLHHRGAPAVRFDPACYPHAATVTATVHPDDPGVLRGRLRHDPNRLDIALESVGAVWVRRPGTPGPLTTGGPRRRAGETVAQDCAAALADVLATMDAAFVPARPELITLAAHKNRQLVLAGRHGFEVPTTVTGNDPDAFLDLVAESDGPVITKRCAPGARMVDEDGVAIGRFTQPVRPADLVHVEALRDCPVIAQAYVAKALELRVTVVGDRVFSAAIDSQSSNHARHDWRRAIEVTPMRTHPLSDDVSDRCIGLTRDLGLHYAAIDLILTPDGRYVFLEVNPTGQYLWIEHATGLPISAALADLLAAADTATTSGARHGRVAHCPR